MHFVQCSTATHKIIHALTYYDNNFNNLFFWHYIVVILGTTHYLFYCKWASNSLIYGSFRPPVHCSPLFVEYAKWK